MFSFPFSRGQQQNTSNFDADADRRSAPWTLFAPAAGAGVAASVGSNYLIDRSTKWVRGNVNQPWWYTLQPDEMAKAKQHLGVSNYLEVKKPEKLNPSNPVYKYVPATSSSPARVIAQNENSIEAVRAMANNKGLMGGQPGFVRRNLLRATNLNRTPLGGSVEAIVAARKAYRRQMGLPEDGVDAAGTAAVWGSRGLTALDTARRLHSDFRTLGAMKAARGWAGVGHGLGGLAMPVASNVLGIAGRHVLMPRIGEWLGNRAGESTNRILERRRRFYED